MEELRDLNLVPVDSGHQEQLAAFFERIATSPAVTFFQPHELSANAAQMLAKYRGKDFYGVVLSGKQILGYGLLRGWDEGYEIPSLGLAIDDRFRGYGLGRLMMEYLHAVARLRGAQRVRLRVKEDNHQALKLYRSMAYELTLESGGYLVGFLTLVKSKK
jgi:ribosomal-protein-alanine N-acetyltransferase